MSTTWTKPALLQDKIKVTIRSSTPISALVAFTGAMNEMVSVDSRQSATIRSGGQVRGEFIDALNAFTNAWMDRNVKACDRHGSDDPNEWTYPLGV